MAVTLGGGGGEGGQGGWNLGVMRAGSLQEAGEMRGWEKWEKNSQHCTIFGNRKTHIGRNHFDSGQTQRMCLISPDLLPANCGKMQKRFKRRISGESSYFA